MKRDEEQPDQPTVIKPMLATLVKEPFQNDNYVYEVKWDGYRIIAFCNNDKIQLQSRGGEDYSKKYPAILKALKQLNTNCILDGELVFINKEGKPDFDALQSVNGQSASIIYYAFDLLWLKGKNMMTKTLIERKQFLEKLLDNNSLIKYSDHFQDGLILFDQIKNTGLEGMVAKRKDSQYLQDDRSKKWVKITIEKRQEFVIGGWIESEKRNTFRTLLFGSYEDGKLKWKGHAGGGYKDKEMPSILNKLKELEIDENPFDTDVQYSEGKPHWVKPELVANIKFSTLTKSGKIRKPAIFLGFRNDKKPEQVSSEKASRPPLSLKNHKSVKETVNHIHQGFTEKLPASSGSNWPLLEAEPVYNSEELHLDDCSIRVTNIDKQLWKGITKAHLIHYYHSMSPLILPHLRNRPLSLNVKYKGPNAPGLYIKDMEDRQPDCAEIFSTERKHKKTGKRDRIDYLVCSNTATLLYIINLGCIDINCWTSSTQNPQFPDFIVIDLDPSDNDFTKAIETARAAKDFFDSYTLKAFIKTSGKTGLHILLPCRTFNFLQARKIAENICESIHQLVSGITTTNVTVADRGNKLYLDPNQNDYTDTLASVYSVRPYKHPLVSTPLQWKEVNSLLTPDLFTIGTIAKRIEKHGDLFLKTLDEKQAHQNTIKLKRFL